MSAITLDLPDDLALRLRALADRLPRFLENALRELDVSSPTRFSGAVDVLELLARPLSPEPGPEEVLAIRASDVLEARVSELLEKSRTDGLSPAEEDEWQRYEYVDHLVQLAKAKAAIKLQAR